MYPIIMAPYFRHGAQTPWGGSMLGDLFMKDVPDDTTGESMEVSCVAGEESMAANGQHTGMSLSAILAKNAAALIGTDSEIFPLQVRLIDAAQPATFDTTDGGAALVVLNCDMGAVLASGDKNIPVRPGDVVYIPAGAGFTAEAGMLLFAASGFSGKGGAQPGKTEGATVLTKGGSITYFAADKGVELARLNVSGKMPVSDGRLHAITPLAPCTIEWDEGGFDVMPMTTVLIPAGLENAAIIGDMKALMTSVPDTEALKELLGYRAENVAALVY